MNIKSKVKSYLIILLFLIIGMLLMGSAQLLKSTDSINSAFLMLVLFVGQNISTAYMLNIKAELYTFWSLKKIYFLPIGILAGGIIVLIPVIAGLLTAETSIGQIKFASEFTPASIFLTLVIVSWEELWFRGIFLNYCNRNLSAITISITIGLLFMLVHVLNPEIDLIKTGPTLFFAGAFLTLVYFYFKTIWLPIGLHFGNNYMSIESNLDKHSILGTEGYLGAIVLAILYILLVKLTIKKLKKLKKPTTKSILL